MDYRLMDPGTTNFIYVLPYAENEALVEFTYFSPHVVEDEVYEQYLKKYIESYLQIANYHIVEREQGNIPMTSYRFEKHSTNLVHKIGTAGGWVKPSTGYSFKRTEKKAAQLIDNYFTGKNLGHEMINKKYRFYDDIMLDVLYKANDRGHLLFQKLYTNNDITRIFSFLDEETTFKEELNIMVPMTSYPFLRSAFTTIFK